ncbi:MAG: hypothetical protein HY791_22285 [Deltaproteobacteria bacterium]|nr:hypothetical protein [Deltaproteobacteria bacterium]
MSELGRKAKGPGTVYLVGGASALLVGWRATTVDVDIKLDPEPAGVFEALAEIKRELDLNIELAAPDQFLPPVPGWRERSPAIGRHGPVEFRHYDFDSQALAKLSRGFERDLLDVEAMLGLGLVSKESVLNAFQAIEAAMLRYPHLDAATVRTRILTFFERRSHA